AGCSAGSRSRSHAGHIRYVRTRRTSFQHNSCCLYVQAYTLLRAWLSGPTRTHDHARQRCRFQEVPVRKEKPALSRGLNARHIRFIALGSAIGTGLFYGSSEAIELAGPSVLLAYLVGGLAVFFVLRALGEMAVDDPTPGSFGEYAARYLGPLAGFVTGWT